MAQRIFFEESNASPQEIVEAKNRVQSAREYLLAQRAANIRHVQEIVNEEHRKDLKKRLRERRRQLRKKSSLAERWKRSKGTKRKSASGLFSLGRRKGDWF